MLLDATIALLGRRSEVEDKHPDIDRLEHERRFLPTSAELDVFIAALKTGLLPEANKTLQAPTTTWTTYLDTEDGLYFLSSDGPTARRLRVREYEAFSDQDLQAPSFYLELKQTMGANRSKIRVAAPIAALARLIESGDLGGFSAGPGARNVSVETILHALGHEHFAPCVGTSYRRRCLASSSELRVTLDEDLTFLYPVSFGAPHDNREALAVGPSRVLEVKYAKSLPDWLARACESLNEAADFSKFRQGMLAVKQAASIAAGPTRATSREPFNDTSHPLSYLVTRQIASL